MMAIHHFADYRYGDGHVIEFSAKWIVTGIFAVEFRRQAPTGLLSMAARCSGCRSLTPAACEREPCGKR
jgi:hypothetical protein